MTAAKNKTGRIDISALTIPPEKHELATARFFAERGKDIKFIKPTNLPGHHTPDFWMDGLAWEVKSPAKSNYTTLEHAYRAALKQSPHIIFDLRLIKKTEFKAARHLVKLLGVLHGTKHLLIITKKGLVVAR